LVKRLRQKFGNISIFSESVRNFQSIQGDSQMTPQDCGHIFIRKGCFRMLFSGTDTRKISDSTLDFSQQKTHTP